MTTTRPELIVEGSDNGQSWEPYVFKYKAGPVDRTPPWVQPHMPRLDWQMWFEALNAERGGPPRPWFQRFLVGLLENREPVVALMAKNPFEGAAPNYIRVRIENYTFTTIEHRRETGEWWAAEERILYVPPISLR
jgi:lipase maturation factor 1